MKKIKSFALIVCMMLNFSACSMNKQINIEHYDWELSVIQSSETGDVLYCSEEMKEVHSDAEVLSLSCSIDEECIILSDDDGKWNIKYTEIERTAESIIYEVEYDEIGHVYVGNAVVSITKYSDESSEHTLNISLGEYTLQFVAE